MNDPRATMPQEAYTYNNPEMASAISSNPTFQAVAAELQHLRTVQAQKWFYTYTLSGQIAGQQSLPFALTIEQGTDFKCEFMTISAFSYDIVNATLFPIPNALGVTSWAGRGLSFNIVDTRAGRDLTSGFVPLELMGTPGYGLNFQQVYPLRYLFYRNSKIRFDVRNRDNATRVHQFEIAMSGYKYMTPQ